MAYVFPSPYGAIEFQIWVQHLNKTQVQMFPSPYGAIEFQMLEGD